MSLSLFTLIKDALTEDGLLDHVKSQMYGFSSDGAAVMLGKNNKLAKLLNDSVSNNLFVVHYLAHRLELCYTHAMKLVDKGDNKLDTFVCLVYSFYYNKSFKCKESLMETAKILGETFYEMKYIHVTCWISAEYTALEKLFKVYGIILSNFESIMGIPHSPVIYKVKQKVIKK